MEGKTITFYQPKEYAIDYSKVNTVEDIVDVLRMLDIKIYDNYIRFEEFKHYLKEI